MKQSKHIISAFITVCLIFTLFSMSAFAATETTSNTYETTMITQSEYLDTISTANSDGQIIEEVCKSFISLGRASVRDDSYSATAMLASNMQLDSTVAYRLSEFEYLAAIHEALDQPILSDSITFSDYSVTVNGETAQAEIVETYEYYTDDGFDGYNFRKRMYTFDLINENGDWEILKVVTDDPWENATFEYDTIDIAAAVDAVLCEIETTELSLASTCSNDRIGKNTTMATTSLVQWSYDTVAAVSYAKKYYSGSLAGGYNTLFNVNTDSDGDEHNCQNFASQCVWAGLCSNLTVITLDAYPSVSASAVGSSALNIWRRNQSSTGLSYPLNWSWDNVCSFAELIERSTTSTIGPFGNTHYGNLKYAAVGDVISCDFDGSPSSTTLDHAMIVTEVTGTLGSRTRANIKIAANTSSTNSAYQTLTSYATRCPSDSYFATSVIDSGYYPTSR